jgi:type II secretory pathway predicted ATPase ExeA
MAKQKKLTLENKRLLSEHVTGETKRCLAVLKNMEKQIKHDMNNGQDPDIQQLYYNAVKELIEGSPFIEFHPELLKRIPE